MILCTIVSRIATILVHSLWTPYTVTGKANSVIVIFNNSSDSNLWPNEQGLAVEGPSTMAQVRSSSLIYEYLYNIMYYSVYCFPLIHYSTVYVGPIIGIIRVVIRDLVPHLFLYLYKIPGFDVKLLVTPMIGLIIYNLSR